MGKKFTINVIIVIMCRYCHFILQRSSTASCALQQCERATLTTQLHQCSVVADVFVVICQVEKAKQKTHKNTFWKFLLILHMRVNNFTVLLGIYLWGFMKLFMPVLHFSSGFFSVFLCKNPSSFKELSHLPHVLQIFFHQV